MATRTSTWTCESHSGGRTGSEVVVDGFYDGGRCGVQGYYDAVEAGKLNHGGDDFVHIHTFFADARLTLVNMVPDDAAVGGKPMQRKCIRDERTYVIYLANADHSDPQRAGAARRTPSVTVQLPPGAFQARWFNPRAGVWRQAGLVRGGAQRLTGPAGEDWALLLCKQEPRRIRPSRRSRRPRS